VMFYGPELALLVLHLVAPDRVVSESGQNEGESNDPLTKKKGKIQLHI